MATYKVIQDIEAEDHILGPLSLRQFIYGLIAALCFYLCYIVISRGAGYLVVLFLPPGLFCAFFAAPFGKDQPTEIWALAKIRFYFKPRKRIWDQSGMKELVSITVPKKVEIHRTDGLSQIEVRSRLSALANTIDSRGWAVKDVDLNLYTRPGLLSSNASSDRLVEVGSLPQQVPSFDVTASDDMLDEHTNPIAQQFDQMINASTQAHRKQIEDMMNNTTSNEVVLPAPMSQAPTKNDNWFMQQASPSIPGTPSQPSTATPLNGGAADDSAVSSQLRAKSQAQDVVYEHMKTIQPINQQSASPQPTPAPAPVQPGPAAKQLATNDDLNISTIARVANKQDLPPDEEVIIPLH